VTVRMLVRDLNVQCSLDVRTPEERRRGGFAMSDACRKHATNAVETETGNYLYRCEEHRGIITVVIGPIWDTVPARAVP
jgi:hypothetical protein